MYISISTTTGKISNNSTNAYYLHAINLSTEDIENLIKNPQWSTN